MGSPKQLRTQYGLRSRGVPTSLFFYMSTTYFIAEASLIFDAIYTQIIGLIGNMNLFFMWGLLFFGIFMFMTLMGIMIKMFFGDK